MRARIPIRLAVEDDLSEYVIRRALLERSVQYDIGDVYCRGGFGYLKKQTASFNNAAKAGPFLLLTDLDQCTCAPTLVAEWIGPGRRVHPHFIFRVAVREVESWLLADEVNLAAFLGLKKSAHLPNPEDLGNPKATLLELAAQSRHRDIREAIVWRDERSGRFWQGPDYNGAMAPFVKNAWNVTIARQRCPSLNGLFIALARLEKSYRTWPNRRGA
jgi:hypothetical protein